jgi:hypothetical protein
MFLNNTSDDIAPTKRLKNKRLATEILQTIEEAVATSNDQRVVRQLICSNSDLI